MKKPMAIYYLMIALASLFPTIALLVLPEGTKKDWLFFGLLFFVPVEFTIGVLVKNWKKGREPVACGGEKSG